MYSDDIKKLYAEKRESKRLILIDFIEIYLKLRLFFPELEEERRNLTSLVQLYFDTDENERQVLKAIKKQYGHLDDHSGVDDLLDDFDSMYEKLYDYCQDAFIGYEDFFSMYGDFFDMLVASIKGDDDILRNNRHRMRLRRMNFQIFDKEYKEKVLVMLPNLEDAGDDLDG